MNQLLKVAISWIESLLVCLYPPRRAINEFRHKTILETENPLATLFEGLSGTTVVIPNLESLSPVWRVAVNPFIESVREDYNTWVQS